MTYDLNKKKINNEIELTKIESIIFEELVKHNTKVVPLEILQEVLSQKYYECSLLGTISKQNITTHIFKINKKHKCIKNRFGFGYYIEEEVKLTY